MAFLATWLGQGGFSLSDGNVTVLLDPYLSDMVGRLEGLKRLVPAPFKPEDTRADLIVITHDHIDHLDADAISVMPKSGIRFAAPDSCVEKLKTLGVASEAVMPFNRGDVFPFGNFLFEAVYAKHTADSIGVCVTADGLSTYFTGDSEFDEQTGAGVIGDILFTCINGRWGNMGIPDALQLAERVGCKTAVPHHYGMFAENTADPEPFLAGIRAQGRRAYRMTHAVPFSLADLLPK